MQYKFNPKTLKPLPCKTFRILQCVYTVKLGGISFTIASDAHAAHDLGKNYDKLETILKEFNITEVAVYEKHKKIMISPFASEGLKL